MNWRRIEVYLEFLIFGIIVGVIEDILAVALATGQAITWEIVGIVVLIAIPFAFIGEVFVDQIDFVKLFEQISKNRKKRR